MSGYLSSSHNSFRGYPFSHRTMKVPYRRMILLRGTPMHRKIIKYLLAIANTRGTKQSLSSTAKRHFFTNFRSGATRDLLLSPTLYLPLLVRD
jgi:hypothetical protein